MAVTDKALAVTPPQGNLTHEQVNLIKRTVANDATDDELALFLYTATRSGLDPLARQIHFVKRKSKDGPARVAIQTGIDGYRLIADRTGRYAGNDDPVFDKETSPTKATVTVYKLVEGVRCPFTATARWAEYYPGDGNPGFMWRKMPHVMLGKCAEALALRKAFPAELSGLYTNEEMEQADRQEKPVEAAADPSGNAPPVLKPTLPLPTGNLPQPRQQDPDSIITKGQRDRFWAIASERLWSESELRQLVGQYGYTSTKDIKVKDYDDICAVLEGGPRNPDTGGEVVDVEGEVSA